MKDQSYEMKKRWDDQLPEIFNFCYQMTFDWPLSRKLSRLTALHADKVLTDQQSGIEKKRILFKIVTSKLLVIYQEQNTFPETVNHKETDRFFLFEKLKKLTQKYRCTPEEILENLNQKYYYRAIHNLPFILSLIMRLKEIEEFSPQEIASIININDDNVNVLIAQAEIEFQKNLWHQIQLQLKNEQIINGSIQRTY